MSLFNRTQSSMVDPLYSVGSNLPFSRPQPRDISDRADESPGGQDAFAVDDALRLMVHTARGVNIAIVKVSNLDFFEKGKIQFTPLNYR